MRRVRSLTLLAPAILTILACGAARLSEITITEQPATVGAIAELQRNAPGAHCAYDLGQSTPAVAVFQCENALVIRFASIDGQLAYACVDTTEARCQEAAAPLLGATPGVAADALEPQPENVLTATP